MGSSISRLGSRPSRPPGANGFKRTLSSLFICGASTSSPRIQMEDDPVEVPVKTAENNDPVADKFQTPTKEFVLTSGCEYGFTSPKIGTAASSEGSVIGIEDSSFEDGSGSVETSNKGKHLSESKELVPPHRLNVDCRSGDRASTSYEDRPFPDPNFAIARVAMDVVKGTDDIMDKDVSQICSGVTQSSSLSHQELGNFPDGIAIENHEHEITVNHNSDSRSTTVISDLPVTLDSIRENTLQEAIPSGLGSVVSEREPDQRDGGVLHVDVVSISSNILSGGTAEINTRESRRNSRRLFWDAFSRRGTRRHSDSRTFIFSTDDSDDLGSYDRWLLDFGGDFFHDGLRGDTRYLGNRTHSIDEQRRHSRSEIWERLRGGIDGIDHRTNICPSGLHPDGTCSCESSLMAEESGPHASISRIVMLAEALFEVLDEIHRQPVSFSLSMVSLPAPESVVNSLPVKNHINKHKIGNDVEQCYICLVEYEQGDKIRVLPCQHEYHMSCVDKWLKEIHGVCPLCRGDVRETEASVSNPGIPSA